MSRLTIIGPGEGSHLAVRVRSVVHQTIQGVASPQVVGQDALPNSTLGTLTCDAEAIMICALAPAWAIIAI